MTHESDSALFVAHTAFEGTEYGQRLANSVRYARYNVTNMSNTEWVGLLGADVNNLAHMPLSYGLAKHYIKELEARQPGSLTAYEAAALKLGLLIHDQGEAIITDITYSEKTAADEILEHTVFAQNHQAFCPGGSNDLLQLICEARDTVVFDNTTKLGRMRAEIEDIGYLRTTLRASRLAYENARPAVSAGLRWLVADVLTNKGAAYVEYAREGTTPGGTYVRNMQAEVSQAFALPFVKDFLYYGDVQHEKVQAFTTAKDNWDNWLEQAAPAA